MISWIAEEHRASKFSGEGAPVLSPPTPREMLLTYLLPQASATAVDSMTAVCVAWIDHRCSLVITSFRYGEMLTEAAPLIVSTVECQTQTTQTGGD